MKSNTGLLLIDDFGSSTNELSMSCLIAGSFHWKNDMTSSTPATVKKSRSRSISWLVFSTNLEPKDLVDDAFLRRIPYKIEVPNPSRENFVKLFAIMCKIYKFEWKPDLVDDLLKRHYEPVDRPLRNCHPRDLLLQVTNYCKYQKKPLELSSEALDFACDNYFSIM